MSSPAEAKCGATADRDARQRALVVFSAQTDLWWLRFLKPGFRHCFAILELKAIAGAGTASRWIVYNPLSNGTQMEACPIETEDTMRAWLMSQGFLVVETHVRPLDARLFGWRPYTCVEAVKRVLRLHAPGVLTPWQLYRWIKNRKRK